MAVDLVLLSRVAFRGREIAGSRLGALLALLAEDLRAGCSTSRLVDGLWPEEGPEHPTRALQVLVSRARAQVGADTIASTPVGYRLTLSEERVDASAVVAHAAAAARCAQAGDQGGALAQAEAGLALWDGAPPSGPAELGDPLSELRASRTATYRALVRARAFALCRLDRRAEAADTLNDLLRENPRDEEVLAQLLLLDAATLGPSAALTRYDVYRRGLRDELGSDPGPELRRVHRSLLENERPLVRRGIPHAPNALLGRDEDIAAVHELLRSSRVVSLVGPGGLGKTRMAYAVAGGVRQRVVHLVALAGVTADEDVVGEVASTLGGGAEGGHRGAPTDAVSGIVNALGSGPALLVLDNCEQVIDGVIDLVRDLVARTAELRVLTTSRTPLGLSSESVYLLPELSPATSAELFRQRANAARPGVELPDDAVQNLCHRLDGLPLALELAAARVRVMSVADIARRLDDRFTLLRGAARDAPERHRTLYAVIDWSWNLLADDARAAMRSLSIFVGGFTAEAAEHLLGDEADVLWVLEQLVDQSLLQAVDAGSGTRFRMLETVREFSAARREEAGETAAVVDRFLAWARDFGVAHHESIIGVGTVASAALTRDEQENLSLALRFGLEREDGTTVAAVAAVLGALWMFEVDFARMASLAGQSAGPLSHLRPAPEYVEVTRTAIVLAAVSALLLQHPAIGRILVALRRLPAPSRPDTPARATGVVLASIAEARGEALATLQLLCDSDEPMLAGMANTVAGFVWQSANDPDSALKAARRTLASFDGSEQQYPWFAVMTHSRIGELCLDLGRGDEAHEHFAATLALLTAMPGLNAFENGSSAARVRSAMILANLQRGAIDEAEQWLETAVREDGEDGTGLPMFVASARAQILLARGEIDAGLRLLREAAAALRGPGRERTHGQPYQETWALEVEAMAVVAHAEHGRLHLVGQLSGRLARDAAKLILETADRASSYADVPVVGAMLVTLAVLDIERGQRTGDESATRSGVRMIALAESFGFTSGFKPTMSSGELRRLAENADGPAYTEAVSEYTGLDGDELRAAASAAVRARDHAVVSESRHA
ncbi:MAG TPA: BTAD domain-containing putative transcriptional regulator [Actinospica sp.]|nr:BTAD domain-containing putative transcriptional regulator [Actinospica sp.]